MARSWWRQSREVAASPVPCLRRTRRSGGALPGTVQEERLSRTRQTPPDFPGVCQGCQVEKVIVGSQGVYAEKVERHQAGDMTQVHQRSGLDGQAGRARPDELGDWLDPGRLRIQSRGVHCCGFGLRQRYRAPVTAQPPGVERPAKA
eukprot:scaffold74022_cov43-Prasinocladus_malaysianus.AAC.2